MRRVAVPPGIPVLVLRLGIAAARMDGVAAQVCTAAVAVSPGLGAAVFRQHFPTARPAVNR